MAWSSWRDAMVPEPDSGMLPGMGQDGLQVTEDPEPAPAQYALCDPGPERPGTEVRVPLKPRSYEERNR